MEPRRLRLGSKPPIVIMLNSQSSTLFDPPVISLMDNECLNKCFSFETSVTIAQKEVKIGSLLYQNYELKRILKTVFDMLLNNFL
jgi:hypothetical protein